MKILKTFENITKNSFPYIAGLWFYLYSLQLYELKQMDIIFLPSKAARITVKMRTRDVMLLIQYYQSTALRFLADSYLYQELQVSDHLSPMRH